MHRVYDGHRVQEVFNNFPTWLRENSKQFTEAWIKPRENGDGYTLSHPDAFDLHFDTIYAAYEASHDAGFCVAFDKELFIRGDVYTYSMEEGEETALEAYEYHLVHTGGLSTPEVPYSMFSTTFAAWVYGMQADFEYFNNLRTTYLQHPESFKAAYEFVEEHPMSWIRPGRQRGATIWMPHDDNTLVPYFELDGEQGEYWMLETGEHEDPDYQRRYFDPKISVFDAATPAEAYIRVAAHIEATFFPDGARKISAIIEE